MESKFIVAGDRSGFVVATAAVDSEIVLTGDRSRFARVATASRP